jgi:hypothetical protein
MPSFDAGRIEATADLNRDPFFAGLEEIRAAGEEWAAGRYEATAGLDDAEGKAKLDEMDARLDAYGHKRETATVDVDSRPAVTGMAAAESQANKTGGALGVLMGSALALSPALVGIGAAGVAGVGALLPVLAAGTLGLGAFAAVAMSGMKDVTTATAAVDKAQAQYNANIAAGMDPLQAQLTLIGATQKAYMGLSTYQVGLVNDLLELKDAWQQVQDQNAPAVLQAMGSAIGWLEQGLTLVSPLVQTTAHYLDQMFLSGRQALESPYWQSFFAQVTTNVNPALRGLGSLLDGAAHAFVGILLAFQPLVPVVEDGMRRIGSALSTWGANLADSKGFQDFLAYVQQVGPQTWDLLKNLGDSFIAITRAISPLARVELPLINLALRELNALLNSPIGPYVANVLLLSLAASKLGGPLTSLFGPLMTVATRIGLVGSAAEGAAGAAGVGGLGASLSGLGSGIVGFVTNPLVLLAAGLVGATLLGHALNDQFDIQIQKNNDNAIAAYKHATGLGEVQAASVGLQHQMHDTGVAMDNAANSGTGLAGVADHIASAFGMSVVSGAQMKQQMDNLTSAYQQSQAAIYTYNIQADELAKKFGLTTTQVEILANSMGIDLTKPISTAQIQQFTSTVQADLQQTGGVSGAVSTIVSQNMQTMQMNALNSANNTHLGVRSALQPLVGDLQAIGQNSTAAYVQEIINAQVKAGNGAKGIHDATMNPLIPVIVQMLQTGDLAGANFVAKLAAAQGPASMAATNVRNATGTGIWGVIGDMTNTGTVAGGGFIGALQGFIPRGATTGASLRDAVAGEVSVLIPDLVASGDTAGLNFVNNLLMHQVGAMIAGKSLHDAVTNVLNPLAWELAAEGDQSGAALIQNLTNQLNQKVQWQVAVEMNATMNNPYAAGAALQNLPPRALGGPVQAGTAYLVGERGAELFVAGLPHFANGGAIVEGMPGLVGENGPEIFIPTTSGTIVPDPDTVTGKLADSVAWQYLYDMAQYNAAHPSGGGVPANVSALMSGLMVLGLTRVGAAGITGNIEAESGGALNSVGSGGCGLIGYTPCGSAPPGGAVSVSGPNPSLMQQLGAVIMYTNANYPGGVGGMNSFGDPGAAGASYAQFAERCAECGPGGSQLGVRAGNAIAAYGSFDKGGVGWLMPGLNILSNQTRRPEPVSVVGPSGAGPGGYVDARLTLIVQGTDLSNADNIRAAVQPLLEEHADHVADLVGARGS